MKFKTIYAMLAILFTATTNLLTAHEEVTTSASSLQKIYVSPEQLHIMHKGIFFLSEEGNLEPTCGVFSDNAGLYVMRVTYQCPACKIRNTDNICHNKKCSMYGK